MTDIVVKRIKKKTPVGLPAALEALHAAQQAYKKAKTYENAVGLQNAERNFEIARSSVITLVEEDTND